MSLGLAEATKDKDSEHVVPGDYFDSSYGVDSVKAAPEEVTGGEAHLLDLARGCRAVHCGDTTLQSSEIGDQVPHKGLTKKGNGKWQVQIWHEGQSRFVGVYNNIAIASSAYHFAMNFVSIKLVTKSEKLSPEDVRADIFALKAFVNKSLKTLLANRCPHQQDKSKGVGGLPVQV